MRITKKKQKKTKVKVKCLKMGNVLNIKIMTPKKRRRRKK